MSYVEPTTGTVYATSEGPYLTVEGVFNDKNFWVNMQQQQQQQQQRSRHLQEQKQQSEREKIDDQGNLAGVVKTGVAGEAATITRASSLSFDLLDGSLWEYVFIDPMLEVGGDLTFYGALCRFYDALTGERFLSLHALFNSTC